MTEIHPDLSIRATNQLHGIGINSLSDLKDYRQRRLLDMIDLGLITRKTYDELLSLNLI